MTVAAPRSLAERFEQERTDTVRHHGRIVRAVAHLPVRDGDLVTVRFIHVGDARPQGLKLGIDDGELEVNGRRGPTVVLWAPTCPPEVELVVHGSGASVLDAWNCWSLGGVDTSWLGNAGMVTRTVAAPDTRAAVALRCSDGIGPADFDDLEVEITVREAP